MAVVLTIESLEVLEAVGLVRVSAAAFVTDPELPPESIPPGPHTVTVCCPWGEVYELEIVARRLSRRQDPDRPADATAGE